MSDYGYVEVGEVQMTFTPTSIEQLSEQTMKAFEEAERRIRVDAEEKLTAIKAVRQEFLALEDKQ